MPTIPEMITSVRPDGLSYMTCLNECLAKKELISNYDRLRGTNLSRTGSPIELMIDEQTGRTNDEIKGFMEFVWEYIYTRCEPNIPSP